MLTFSCSLFARGRTVSINTRLIDGDLVFLVPEGNQRPSNPVRDQTISDYLCMSEALVNIQPIIKWILPPGECISV